MFVCKKTQNIKQDFATYPCVRQTKCKSIAFARGRNRKARKEALSEALSARACACVCLMGMSCSLQRDYHEVEAPGPRPSQPPPAQKEPKTLSRKSSPNMLHSLSLLFEAALEAALLFLGYLYVSCWFLHLSSCSGLFDSDPGDCLEIKCALLSLSCLLTFDYLLTSLSLSLCSLTFLLMLSCQYTTKTRRES